MTGGGRAPQTQAIAGTLRAATFTADNSETAYSFTVQAENKAGKGPVSSGSTPRRATGKLGTVSSVSTAPANTDGAGRQLTINFKELTAAERNGSAREEVSYSYNASNGTTGSVVPGQQVGGFANGAAVSITVVANSSVAPSSDASARATATPYGSPGTPSAGGQNGALNDQTVTLSWSSPSTSTNDVAVTKIRISPGGGWESVAPSGSRTINTGGWQQSRTISVQTFNSLGTASAEVSATATSGRQGLWETKLTPGTGLVRSCTYTLGGANYRPAPYYDCDGINAHRAPWLYTDDADRLVVRCYIIQSDHWTPDPIRTWYRIESGSTQSVGRYVVAGSTTIGEPSSSGVPPC
jgi:hypothetical protein